MNRIDIFIVKTILIIVFVTIIGNFRAIGQRYINSSDRVIALSRVWYEVKQNYPYFERFPDLNWDSLYYAYLNKVIYEEDPIQYYSLLKEFVAVLRDGHTKIKIPKEYQNTTKVGLYIMTQYINNNFIVCDVGMKLKNTIPVGSILIRINGEDPLKYIQQNISNKLSHYSNYSLINNSCLFLFYGDVGDTIIANFRLTNRDSISVTLPLVHTNDKWSNNYKIISSPSFFLKNYLVDSIAYINMGGKFNKNLNDTLYNVLSTLNAKGIIFDLRASKGGSSLSHEITDYFTDSANYCFSKYSTRISNAYYKSLGGYCDSTIVNEIGGVLRNCNYNEYYKDAAFEDYSIYVNNTFPKKTFNTKIPIVILSNWTTLSAAEFFYISLKNVRPNIVVVGTPSGGSAVQPLIISLPNGGYLYLASMKAKYSNGSDFTFIHPDFFIEPSVKQLQNSDDIVLEKAIKVMKSLISK
jgi:hypothetical protein